MNKETIYLLAIIHEYYNVYLFLVHAIMFLDLNYLFIFNFAEGGKC